MIYNHKTLISLFSKKLSPIAILLITAIIIASCDPGRVYDESREIPPAGWHKDSAAVFVTEMNDTVSTYDFYINLRHTTDYRYSNFYLFLNTFFPNQSMARDTIELILADKTGEWQGSGFGSIKDLQVPVRKNLRFPVSGIYRFEIEQAMRQDTLRGISNIGIRIEKHQE